MHLYRRACEICVAGDVVLFDADGDGICDSDKFQVAQMNWRATLMVATDEDDSCLYLDQCGVCGGEGIQLATATAMATSLTHWVSVVGTVSPTRMGMAFATAMKMVEDRPIAVGNVLEQDSAACVLLISLMEVAIIGV